MAEQRIIVVQAGQCMEDIALQEYGSIDGVTRLLLDNRDVFVDGYSTDLASGTELVITGEPIDKDTYTKMQLLQVIPATNSTDGPALPDGGDYNNDYNNDHLTN